jgi:hypothetical protein
MSFIKNILETIGEVGGGILGEILVPEGGGLVGAPLGREGVDWLWDLGEEYLEKPKKKPLIPGGIQLVGPMPKPGVVPMPPPIEPVKKTLPLEPLKPPSHQTDENLITQESDIFKRGYVDPRPKNPIVYFSDPSIPVQRQENPNPAFGQISWNSQGNDQLQRNILLNRMKPEQAPWGKTTWPSFKSYH